MTVFFTYVSCRGERDSCHCALLRRCLCLLECWEFLPVLRLQVTKYQLKGNVLESSLAFSFQVTKSCWRWSLLRCYLNCALCRSMMKVLKYIQPKPRLELHFTYVAYIKYGSFVLLERFDDVQQTLSVILAICWYMFFFFLEL